MPRRKQTIRSNPNPLPGPITPPGKTNNPRNKKKDKVSPAGTRSAAVTEPVKRRKTSEWTGRGGPNHTKLQSEMEPEIEPEMEPEIEPEIKPEIYIKTASGETFNIEFLETDTILDLKNKINALSGISQKKMILSFSEKKLVDSKTLKYYNIDLGATLLLIEKQYIKEIKKEIKNSGQGKPNLFGFEIPSWLFSDNLNLGKFKKKSSKRKKKKHKKKTKRKTIHKK
jgi:hypothetical protein